ncbi:hypothetical protein F4778DRAFT_731613 [Xylariomycetidae sp. FL2044]|nr:hypothetical protein F4778DRAFT_731613 [Xylariomycetidae sp. FL2044]
MAEAELALTFFVPLLIFLPVLPRTPLSLANATGPPHAPARLAHRRVLEREGGRTVRVRRRSGHGIIAGPTGEPIENVGEQAAKRGCYFI